MNASLDLPGDGNKKKCAEKNRGTTFFCNAAALNVNSNGNMHCDIMPKDATITVGGWSFSGGTVTLRLYIIPAFACKSGKEGFANE